LNITLFIVVLAYTCIIGRCKNIMALCRCCNDKLISFSPLQTVTNYASHIYSLMF